MVMGSSCLFPMGFWQAAAILFSLLGFFFHVETSFLRFLVLFPIVNVSGLVALADYSSTTSYFD